MGGRSGLGARRGRPLVVDIYEKKQTQKKKVLEELESIKSKLGTTLAVSSKGANQVLSAPQKQLLKNTIGFKGNENIHDLLDKITKYKKEQK